MAEIIEMATNDENVDLDLTVGDIIEKLGTDTFSMADMVPEEQLEEADGWQDLDDGKKSFIKALTIQFIETGTPVLAWEDDGGMTLDITLRIRSSVDADTIASIIAATEEPEE